MTAYWYCELAWLGGPAASRDVLIATDGERITSVTPDATEAPRGAFLLRGLTIPGLVNAHSHAFHRALRGRTQAERGTFWTWREQMYAVAATLTPETYYGLARATYAEMLLAGISCVGEFHYLHHGPDGTAYDNPNAMGDALVAAAHDAGIRSTLLDTAYLAGGIGKALAGPQLRFGDADADAWTKRVATLKPAADLQIGAALHSVRGVPREQMGPIVGWAAHNAAPLHVHLSEQRAENDACLAAYGLTPTQLLADAGALGERTTAVHATHLTDDDRGLLATSRTCICMCPTTERDLADGIGPARALHDAGAPVSLGSDSHAVIDVFEEARALELDERLRTETRGHWNAAELLDAATAAGARSLGWYDAGRLAAGALADFATVALDTPRMAGTTAENAAAHLVFAASAADVRDVVVGGRHVVRNGHHATIDVAAELSRHISPILT